MKELKTKDPELYSALEGELNREEGSIELIASENFVSKEVLQAQGSVLTNKYAEGYPGKRYYGGCYYVDKAEELARNRMKQLFNAEHANVQPHSGASANMGVYLAVLRPGDKVLGMDLAHGGHLTHGSAVNISGKYYNFVFYGIDKDSGYINYENVRKRAREEQPKMIVAGASAYPRQIDFKKFRDIADEVGAYLMVDMAHIAGLVACGLHPDPVPYADFVTTTTHKTLRGPRGGAILCKEEFKKKIDSAVFPGLQGGPLMHVIAAKAVAFKEALTPEFKEYQQQIKKNAVAFADELMNLGYELVSHGTDNHLLLLDLRRKNITGKIAEKLLDDVNITVNKNAVPDDPEKPTVTSGLRLGTPAVTTRGLKEQELRNIARLIDKTINDGDNESTKTEVRDEVKNLTEKFPLYRHL